MLSRLFRFDVDADVAIDSNSRIYIDGLREATQALVAASHHASDGARSISDGAIQSSKEIRRAIGHASNAIFMSTKLVTDTTERCRQDARSAVDNALSTIAQLNASHDRNIDKITRALGGLRRSFDVGMISVSRNMQNAVTTLGTDVRHFGDNLEAGSVAIADSVEQMSSAFVTFSDKMNNIGENTGINFALNTIDRVALYGTAFAIAVPLYASVCYFVYCYGILRWLLTRSQPSAVSQSWSSWQ